MPGVSGVTVVTNARAFYTPRAAAGAPGARHSLRPLMGRNSCNNSGALRCEDAEVWQEPRRGHPSRRGLLAAPQDEVVTNGAASDPHGEEAQSAVSNHEAHRYEAKDGQIHFPVRH